MMKANLGNVIKQGMILLKAVLIALAGTVFVFVCTYVTAGFTTQNWAVSNWSEMTRFFVAIITFMGMVASIGLALVNVQYWLTE